MASYHSIHQNSSEFGVAAFRLADGDEQKYILFSMFDRDGSHHLGLGVDECVPKDGPLKLQPCTALSVKMSGKAWPVAATDLKLRPRYKKSENYI